MLKSTFAIAALVSAASPGQVFAQDTTRDEFITLKDELQSCIQTKQITARDKCFKTVTTRAVAMIERVPVKAAKTEDETKADADAQAKKEQDAKYQTFVSNAKAALVSDFKDPGSAQWRGIFISTESDDPKGSVWFICGEVNAKNSYGGYIGFRRFYTIDTKGRIPLFEEESDSVGANDAFERMWINTCSKNIYNSPS